MADMKDREKVKGHLSLHAVSDSKPGAENDNLIFWCAFWNKVNKHILDSNESLIWF